MATRTEREQLIGIAMTRDQGFRDWLLKDPQDAASSVGIKLTDTEARYIQSLDGEKLDKAADLFRSALADQPTMAWGG